MNSAFEPESKEAKAAREWIDRLEREFLTNRNRAIVGAATFSLAAGGAVAAELPMITLILACVAILFALRAYDDNGSVHDVRRRSKKRLVPDLSAFARPAESSRKDVAPQGEATI